MARLMVTLRVGCEVLLGAAGPEALPWHWDAQGVGWGCSTKELGELVPQDWLWECRQWFLEKEAPIHYAEKRQPSGRSASGSFLTVTASPVKLGL